jgi:hypothetical protein
VIHFIHTLHYHATPLDIMVSYNSDKINLKTVFSLFTFEEPIMSRVIHQMYLKYFSTLLDYVVIEHLKALRDENALSVSLCR